jgi:hypothetical protein
MEKYCCADLVSTAPNAPAAFSRIFPSRKRGGLKHPHPTPAASPSPASGRGEGCFAREGKDALRERGRMLCARGEGCFAREGKDALCERGRMLCATGERCVAREWKDALRESGKMYFPASHREDDIAIFSPLPLAGEGQGVRVFNFSTLMIIKVCYKFL